jgi:hypothetical protein
MHAGVSGSGSARTPRGSGPGAGPALAANSCSSQITGSSSCVRLILRPLYYFKHPLPFRVYHSAPTVAAMSCCAAHAVLNPHPGTFNPPGLQRPHNFLNCLPCSHSS